MRTFRKVRLFAGLLACLQASSCKIPGASQLQGIDVDARESKYASLDLMKGFDTIKDASADHCLIGKTAPNELASVSDPSNGLNIDVKVRIIERKKTKNSGLSLSGSVSGVIKVLTLGLVGSFEKKLTETQYNAHLAVEMYVEKARESLYPENLTPRAKEALAKGTGEFFSLCGDKYVSSKVMGGALIVLFSAKDNSIDKFRKIAGEINAGVSPAPGAPSVANASLSISSSLRNFLSSSDVDINVFQMGGDKLATSATSRKLEEALKGIDNFPESVKKNPVNIKFELSDYQTAVTDLKLDGKMERIAAADGMKKIKSDMQTAYDYLDIYSSVVDDINEYPQADLAGLEAELNKITIGASTAKNAKDRCMVDDRACRDYKPYSWDPNLKDNIKRFAGYHKYTTIIHEFELSDPDGVNCSKAVDSSGVDFKRAPAANVDVIFAKDGKSNMAVMAKLKVRMETLGGKGVVACEGLTSEKWIFNTEQQWAGWKVSSVEAPHRIISNVMLTSKIDENAVVPETGLPESKTDPRSAKESFRFTSFAHNDYEGDVYLTGDGKGKDINEKTGQVRSARIYNVKLKGRVAIKLVNTNPNPLPPSR